MLFAPLLLALAQQPVPPTPADVPPAEQTGVQPSPFGTPAPSIAVGEPSPEAAGSESTTTGEVLRYEEGRSIVLREDSGRVTAIAIPSTLRVPPELAVGRRVAVTTRPSGRGTLVTAVLMAPAAPSASPAAPVATPRPPAPPRRAAAARRPAATQITGTVTAYEPGRSLSVEAAKGAVVTLKLTARSRVPKDLAVSRRVTVTIAKADGESVVLRVR